jgi:hypothetical protein
MRKSKSGVYMPNPELVVNLYVCGTRLKDGRIMIEDDKVLDDFPKAIAACGGIYTLQDIELDDETPAFDGGVCEQRGIYEYASATKNKIAAYKPRPFEISGFDIRGHRLANGEVEIGDTTFQNFPEKVEVCGADYGLDCIKQEGDSIELGAYCIKPVGVPMMNAQDFIDALFKR